MNTATEEQQESINQVYEFATTLLIKENRSIDYTKNALIEKGLDDASATVVITKIVNQVGKSKDNGAQKDIIWGLVWCVGGLVATMADVGYIFWGAIVFGAIQFFKGLSNL